MSDQTNSEQQLAASLQDGVARNFTPQQTDIAPQGIQGERLRDMEKKLPEWSLEPPTTFLEP